jgi:hypothetical protein
MRHARSVRRWNIGGLRQVLPSVLLGALFGCTDLPTMPTAADFQKARENPIVTQPSLGGRVTDAVSAAPIVGATVTVQGRSVISSITGHYGFDPNMTAGLFLAKVTHPQYVDSERSVEVKPFGMADFILQPK